MTCSGPEAYWESRNHIFSKVWPGVVFVIPRMTFGRRLTLMRRVRDLASKLEYFEAGRDAKNNMEASLLAAEIDRLYLLWGLEEIRGLELDGETATPEMLVERGPEDLVYEALAAIKAAAGLSETERKN
jgi:hypothetical protein